MWLLTGFAGMKLEYAPYIGRIYVYLDTFTSTLARALEPQQPEQQQ